jgi:hypothetical protein
MYHKALELTDEHGQGWHENSVGEMEAEQTEELDVLDQNLDELIDASSRLSHSIKSMIEQLRRLYINRNMIDIEPHYLLGLRLIKPEDISEPDADRMRRVARYVLDHAERNDLITFKRVPTFFKRHRDDDYTHEGNWRDSREAYKMIHPVIAPYDVNVVFYPQALRTMLQHAKWLNIDPSHIEPLIAKWDRVREWFRFTNADGSAGYALALYDVQTLEPGVKYRRMEVNHLDESYDLFYGQPAEVDVINFAERLISPDYFYTPSGPLLVGANDGFETTDYHGKVIWTKQTAFTVAGLERQLKLHGASWKPATRELANKALTATVEASVAAFKSLGAAPELHYDYKGQPRFYTDQKHAKGPMNLIQLWSAVGARRIMNAYNEASNGR